MIKFINWFSIYNIVPRGMILKMCLGNLKKNSIYQKKKIIYENNIKKKYKLISDQENALNNLIKSGNKFSVSVLLGVTGSGKTLVYFERIKKLIKENKQVFNINPRNISYHTI